MTVDAHLINAILPQTQCGECSYPGCLPYAQALSQGAASIDRCPPGGIKVLQSLGELLGIDPSPFLQAMQEKTRAPAVAKIREPECIGCTKCIQACPIDAIVGSPKLMHTIIEQECTGCGLCVEPCPVDCIDIEPQRQPTYLPAIAKKRFEAKNIRQLQEAQEKEHVYRERRRLMNQTDAQQQEKMAKQQYILEAIKRARVKTLVPVDNCSISFSTPTFRGISAESMDPADAPRGIGVELKCQQPLESHE